jgi:hypothetical protein
VSTQDPNDLRDPRLDAAWRAASNEEPPAALDDAIRAAARREVKAGPQPSGAPITSVPQSLRPERWWMPLAAAATIGAIAIGILQIANPDKVIAPAHDKAIVSDMPSSPSSTTERAPTPATPPPAAADDIRSRAAAEAPAPAAAPASVPAPKPAPTLRKDIASKSAREEQATKQEALAPATPSGGGRQAGAVEAAKPSTPMQPMAEPFPADALKREAKESAAAAPSPPASMPAESPAAGLAANKLKSVPAQSARDEKASESQRANAQFAQSPAPAAQAPMRRTQEADASRAGALKADAANTAVGAAVDTGAKVRPKLVVPDWIALIRKLRDEGKMDEAAKELAAFRTAYPDHERLLPADLRDWKPAQR